MTLRSLRVFATLPILDGADAESIEVIRTCADCGEASSASLCGAAGWSYRKTGPFGLKDICPTCGPRLHPAQRKFFEETEKTK